MRDHGHALGAALLMCSAQGAAETARSGCLHAVEFDGNPVVACDTVDPLHVANSPAIMKLMAAMKVPADKIQFIGCPDLPFATTELVGGSASTYEVAYASNVKDKFLVATLAHELAHVAEMQLFGSLAQLRSKYKIQRIELGADFIVGFEYAKTFPKPDLMEFQSNIHLTGKYFEDLSSDAHGSIEDRTAAFRLGAFYVKNKGVDELKVAFDDFQDDLYDQYISR